MPPEVPATALKALAWAGAAQRGSGCMCSAETALRQAKQPTAWGAQPAYHRAVL